MALMETWSLKTIFVFESLLLQMSSDSYLETVSTSDGLNLGQALSLVLADNPLDPPAQGRSNVFGCNT